MSPARRSRLRKGGSTSSCRRCRRSSPARSRSASTRSSSKTCRLPRAEADRDPSLIRLKANLIPRLVDPLRVIDIVGLDRQADGGTHVASTAEVRHVRVVKAESKGKANKRIRIALDE